MNEFTELEILALLKFEKFCIEMHNLKKINTLELISNKKYYNYYYNLYKIELRSKKLKTILE